MHSHSSALTLERTHTRMHSHLNALTLECTHTRMHPSHLHAPLTLACTTHTCMHHSHSHILTQMHPLLIIGTYTRTSSHRFIHSHSYAFSLAHTLTNPHTHTGEPSHSDAPIHTCTHAHSHLVFYTLGEWYKSLHLYHKRCFLFLEKKRFFFRSFVFYQFFFQNALKIHMYIYIYIESLKVFY